MSDGSIKRTERCHAITKRDGKDNRCKHTTVRGIYCWQHLKVKKGLRIMKSELPGAGKGLYTTKPIPRGAVIAKYTGDVVIEMDPDYGNPYALKIADTPPTYIDASRTNTGEARWANDARNEGAENAELHYDPAKKQGYLQATRDIDAGEEIYTDYGPDYWENKPTIPNLKKRREVRKNAVREVEEVQQPEPAQPKPRRGKLIKPPAWEPEPLPEYIEPVARVRKQIKEPEPVPVLEVKVPKPRKDPKQVKKLPKYSKYVAGLRHRLHVIQTALKSQKMQAELGLQPRKVVFDLPPHQAEPTLEHMKDMEELSKLAMKLFHQHLNSGKQKVSMAKAHDIIDTLVKRGSVKTSK